MLSNDLFTVTIPKVETFDTDTFIADGCSNNNNHYTDGAARGTCCCSCDKTSTSVA